MKRQRRGQKEHPRQTGLSWVPCPVTSCVTPAGASIFLPLKMRVPYAWHLEGVPNSDHHIIGQEGRLEMSWIGLLRLWCAHKRMVILLN